MTSSDFSDADCLALVERSPAAVAAHDKAAWLSLFARYNLLGNDETLAQVMAAYDLSPASLRTLVDA